MKITFDPQKRLRTLRERGLDFAVDAEKVFAGRLRTYVDQRVDYGEQRLITVGWLHGRMVYMVWTERSTVRHIISMRFCHVKEQDKFAKRFNWI